MKEIPQIGSCCGCNKGRRLFDGACKDCVARFGPKAGQILQRIKSDPQFATMCYEACDVFRKRAFAELFGVPEGCKPA